MSSFLTLEQEHDDIKAEGSVQGPLPLNYVGKECLELSNTL